MTIIFLYKIAIKLNHIGKKKKKKWFFYFLFVLKWSKIKLTQLKGIRNVKMVTGIDQKLVFTETHQKALWNSKI